MKICLLVLFNFSMLSLSAQSIQNEIKELDILIVQINTKIATLKDSLENVIDEKFQLEQGLTKLDISDDYLTGTLHSAAHLRKNPVIENDSVIVTIPENEELLIIGYKDKYWHVQYGNNRGYVFYTLIQKTESTSLFRKVELQKEFIKDRLSSTVIETTNIRSSHLKYYRNVYEIQQGELIVITGAIDSFYQVEKINTETEKVYAGCIEKSKIAKGEGVIEYEKKIVEELKNKEEEERLRQTEIAKRKLEQHKEVEKSYNEMFANEFKIAIAETKITSINSAGGANLKIGWYYNNPNKIIKYVRFHVKPYNAVGGVVSSDIGNKTTLVGLVTGPITASRKLINNYWDSAWYNNTIVCVKITKIEVEYMDGSSYVFINELPKIINSKYNDYCPF